VLIPEISLMIVPSPRRMIDPLPNAFSISETAASSDFVFSRRSRSGAWGLVVVSFFGFCTLMVSFTVDYFWTREGVRRVHGQGGPKTGAHGWTV
jgi:hypothetical protein